MTEKELYFLKALPKRQFRIPIKSITAVSNPRSHLGKTNVAKLLRVDFTKNGQKDATAWMLGNEVDDWTQTLEDIRQSASD